MTSYSPLSSSRPERDVVKIWVEPYLDDDDEPQTALYNLPAVPRKGEQFEVGKFIRVGTVQSVRWTSDEDQRHVDLVVHAK